VELANLGCSRIISATSRSNSAPLPSRTECAKSPSWGLKQPATFSVSARSHNMTILSHPALLASQAVFTYDEAAKWLRISKNSLRNRVDEGDIKPIRFGRSVRFSADELKRFVDSRMAASA
jgi:excisionase family DNA binding protein